VWSRSEINIDVEARRWPFGRLTRLSRAAVNIRCGHRWGELAGTSAGVRDELAEMLIGALLSSVYLIKRDSAQLIWRLL
jgi:hypothetical protein